MNNKLFTAYKLASIGFNGNSIAWFRNYLTGTQTVKFGNSVSPEKSVLTGIGYGTILGHLLFIFYINDIVSVIRNLKINMYADDCILYTSGNDWNRMMQKIQPEIDNVQQWCTSNRLNIIVSRSRILLFGSHTKLGKVDYSANLSLGNSTLNYCNKYKYLGVTLDREMTRTSLLTDTKRSVTNRLFNLRKLRHYITEKSTIAIYKQTILPVFDYAGFILISCNKSDRHDLQILKNDALRTCFNVKRRDKLSVASMHKKAKLLSLEQQRSLQLLSLMYLHKNNVDNLRVFNRNTRAAQRDQFDVERYNNIKYRNSPFYKGVELWNLIPMDILTSDSIFQFKHNLKRKYTTYCDTTV